VAEERIDFVFDEKRERRSSVSPAVAVSIVFHALFLVYVVHYYKPVAKNDAPTPMLHYVQLMRQNPQFTEAPGPKVESAPITAPFSDANRKASMPKPTGQEPTKRPGEGGFYTPPRGSQGAPRPQAATPSAEQAASQPAPSSQTQASTTAPTFTYRPPVQAATGIDWRSAIREVGKIASLGAEQQGMDFGNGGGEKGFAESGPISFESQWYNWGEYASSMVSKIRVNWYNNMPQLIKTGMKGVVTIRFTIQRDGRMTDITILDSSDVPPYDFAAKKAIELASPLNPLPLDFPNATERVTCIFYYNQEPPLR
jgi:TonB family protein